MDTQPAVKECPDNQEFLTPKLLPLLLSLLLYPCTVLADKTVCTSGCDFATINAALSHGPSAGETIVVSPGTYMEGGLSVGARTLRSSSNNPSDTIIDATGTGQTVLSATSATIKGLTIRGGSNPSGVGGGVVHGGGTVILENVIVEYNSAKNGGGIGGETGTSDLEIIESTIQNNTATVSGGGLRAATDDTIITDSTIRDNAVVATSGSTGGGGIEARSFTTVLIERSTISGNATSGGSSNSGGGIKASGTSMTINNSTISDNEAGGSFARGGAFYTSSPITLSSSTIAGNTAATETGGLYKTGSAVYTLSGSILANNSVGNCSTGAINDNGGNLSDDSTCGTVPDTLTGLDTVLSDNGGPTKTHALLPGSNAIDYGGSCGLASDQRGETRVGDCDSGAFELIGCIDKLLKDQTITSTVIEVACHTARLGPGLSVAASGDLTVKAGSRIILQSGVTVETGGILSLEIE